MTFGEKIKEARLAMNLSQTELAQMTGISERSLYTYEQLGTLPRKSNIRKLAEALHISVSYLLDESETDSQSHIDQDMFILEAKENFGSKGNRHYLCVFFTCKVTYLSALDIYITAYRVHFSYNILYYC